MPNTHHDLEQTEISFSAPEILMRTWKIGLCALLGVGLLIGLIAVVLIAIAVVLYQFQPKFLGIMLILGGTVFLVAATAWWIARYLWKNVKRLISNSESPDVHVFLRNALAAFVIVCC